MITVLTLTAIGFGIFGTGFLAYKMFTAGNIFDMVFFNGLFNLASEAVSSLVKSLSE
jgi:hypothetical protein